MKIFISGASGLVGGNCLRYFLQKNLEVKGSYRTFPTPDTVYYDSLDEDSPDNFDLVAYHPDVIVHCGALTHVDYCENHEAESHKMNVEATKAIVKTAKEIGAKFVFISSDYVLDGQAGPYLETAQPNPLNVYGKHKLEAEQLVQNHLDNFLILRVTNVYGQEKRNKNFIARLLTQCKNGDSIDLKLPDDQFATPVNAMDIARALFLLLEADKKGVYHIAGTDYMNRVSLALKVLQHFPEVPYTLKTWSTKRLNQPANRPLLGGLINAKFLSEFPDFLFSSVDEYLNAWLKEE